MTEGVKRLRISVSTRWSDVECPSGGYVGWDDHEREVTALRNEAEEELEKLAATFRKTLDTMEAHIAEVEGANARLTAERDALRAQLDAAAVQGAFLAMTAVEHGWTPTETP